MHCENSMFSFWMSRGDGWFQLSVAYGSLPVVVLFYNAVTIHLHYNRAPFRMIERMKKKKKKKEKYCV